MIKSTRSLLDRLLRPDDSETDQATDDALKLAIAALLVEVVQADFETSIVEREQVLGSLALLLELDADARAALLELASREIDQAHDLHQFTSRINEGFTPERKLLLLEQLCCTRRPARAQVRGAPDPPHRGSAARATLGFHNGQVAERATRLTGCAQAR